MTWDSTCHCEYSLLNRYPTSIPRLEYDLRPSDNVEKFKHEEPAAFGH